MSQRKTVRSDKNTWSISSSSDGESDMETGEEIDLLVGKTFIKECINAWLDANGKELLLACFDKDRKIVKSKPALKRSEGVAIEKMDSKM